MTAAPTIAGHASIWLIRHAPTSWTGRRWCGTADPPLSGAGRRAARELAERLAPELPPDAVVVTSPARRARMTADAIGSIRGLLVVTEPSLAEVDVGAVEGLTWDELTSRDPAFAAALVSGRAVDWPGGESARDVQERASAAALRLAAIAGSRPAVVVSHGAFLHVLGPLLGASTSRLSLEPCGVTRIDR